MTHYSKTLLRQGRPAQMALFSESGAPTPLDSRPQEEREIESILLAPVPRSARRRRSTPPPVAPPEPA